MRDEYELKNARPNPYVAKGDEGRADSAKWWATGAVEAPMTLTIEFGKETNGRWIAEVPPCPGVLIYGDTQKVIPADEAFDGTVTRSKCRLRFAFGLRAVGKLR